MCLKAIKIKSVLSAHEKIPPFVKFLKCKPLAASMKKKKLFLKPNRKAPHSTTHLVQNVYITPAAFRRFFRVEMTDLGSFKGTQA
jgi:hypothetical protein